MKAVNPYLNFKGNTEEAFNFYKSVFGGEFLALIRFKDTPEAERVDPKDVEKIMHISLPLGKSNLLMATDALESMGHSLARGNDFYLSIDAESEEEANTLFDALAQGGKVEVPMEKMFWGAFFGQLRDRFGIHWMINCNSNIQ
jgi:PhnB protein